MTATLTERSAGTETGGCRFSAWCNGFCLIENQVSGEINHWSNSRHVASAEYWDEAVGVELYSYELDGNIDGVRVCLAIGDEVSTYASTTLSPAEARELGNILTGFRTTDFPFDNGVLWHRDDEHVLMIYVEFQQPRDRRDGRRGRQTVEVSIRDGANHAADRAQLELDDARKLGRLLLEGADQADQSNTEFGLVQS